MVTLDQRGPDRLSATRRTSSRETPTFANATTRDTAGPCLLHRALRITIAHAVTSSAASSPIFFSAVAVAQQSLRVARAPSLMRGGARRDSPIEYAQRIRPSASSRSIRLAGMACCTRGMHARQHRIAVASRERGHDALNISTRRALVPQSAPPRPVLHLAVRTVARAPHGRRAQHQYHAGVASWSHTSPCLAAEVHPVEASIPASPHWPGQRCVRGDPVPPSPWNDPQSVNIPPAP